MFPPAPPEQRCKAPHRSRCGAWYLPNRDGLSSQVTLSRHREVGTAGLAKIVPQRRGMWHAIRPKWATERKGYPNETFPRLSRNGMPGCRSANRLAYWRPCRPCCRPVAKTWVVANTRSWTRCSPSLTGMRHGQRTVACDGPRIRRVGQTTAPRLNLRTSALSLT